MAERNLVHKALGGVQAGSRGTVVISNEINAVALGGIAAADVVKAIAVSAGDLVMAVLATIITAEGAVLTMNIGDTTDPDGYLAAVDGNVVGMTGTELTLTEGAPNTVAAYSGGKLYTEDGTIDIVFANAAENAVVKVSALIARLG